MTFRTLPVEEWHRLVEDGIEPYATYGPPPDASHWVLIVAEDDRGRIVGCSSLVETVQNHWYIAPECRREMEVGLGLWKETLRTLQTHGVPQIHATVEDSQVDVQSIVERLGFVPADGLLYVLDVSQAKVQ